jgi:preprotein translocase subunit YajC
MFLPLILLFAIFYFLMIRPQQKRQKEHKALLANLRKGDQVITAGGMYGRITGITDTVVTIEIAEKVRVKVARGQISTKLVTQSDRPK